MASQARQSPTTLAANKAAALLPEAHRGGQSVSAGAANCRRRSVLSTSSAAPVCRLIYIRPDPRHNLPGYSADGNKILEFDDYNHIREHHPEVMLFQDLLNHQRETDGPGSTFNELQLMLHAECERYISVQGGTSILASYFAGTNIVFAKMGQEVEEPGVYSFVYTRLDGGAIVHVRTYEELFQAVRERFLLFEGLS